MKLAHKLLWVVQTKLIKPFIAMKTKIFFVLFLIRKRALVSYLSNLRNMNFYQILSLFTCKYWVTVAFIFRETTEGYEYWKSLDAVWKKLCDYKKF